LRLVQNHKKDVSSAKNIVQNKMNSKFHNNIPTSATLHPRPDCLITQFEAEIAGRIPDIKPIMVATMFLTRTFSLRTKNREI
jgi:hypothetical protein